jgi:anion-transporting  ArsA/GET3 family ATPase
MNLVAHAAAGGAFDVIVIDTAPSRHAIDFVTYPGRLAALLGGRTVAWLAGLAQRAATPPGEARSGGLLSWGRRSRGGDPRACHWAAPGA